MTDKTVAACRVPGRSARAAPSLDRDRLQAPDPRPRQRWRRASHGRTNDAALTASTRAWPEWLLDCSTFIEYEHEDGLEDERINQLFADTDIFRLREKLIEQFCVEAAGPCTYTGDSMEAVHAGMDINEAQFHALVEDLLDAMEARAVPVGAQNRLIEHLAPMRGQIIDR